MTQAVRPPERPPRPRRGRPRWSWAATANLVAILLLGAVVAGVLSLNGTLDRSRRAQVLIAELSHLVDSVRYQPWVHLSGRPVSDAEAAVAVANREQLHDTAVSLRGLTPLGDPILAAVEDLNRAVEAEFEALTAGDLRRAARIDATRVSAAYAELGPTTRDGASTGGVQRPTLWSSTRDRLAREAEATSRDIDQMMVAAILGAGGLIIAVMAVGSRLRRRAAQHLAQQAAEREAAEHQAALLRNSTDLVVVEDPAGRVVYASPAAERMLGFSPEAAKGQRARDWVHEDDSHLTAESLRQVLASPHSSRTQQARLRHADGSYRVAEICFTNLIDDPLVRGVVANVRDITDRTRLEAELRHAQKLESVGQLASGIAHEINTPIQFIGDNVRFLGDAFESLLRAPDQADDPDREYLAEEVPAAIEQTLDGVDRVATIVRAMKAFGHPGTEEKSPIDLNEAVRNTLIVARNTIKHTAEVVTDLGDLPRVWCHQGDINQILVNLVVNAAHAIADTGTRGTITIRTRLDGGEVVVEVQDTGCGISDAVAPHVFEQFFTTKEVGRGTGQGLALAYALVTERHDGTIGFAPRPGGGTVFTVRLPVGGEAPAGRPDAGADTAVPA